MSLIARGDEVTPLPSLFKLSEHASKYFELGKVYVVREIKDVDGWTRNWLSFAENDGNWWNPDYWKLAGSTIFMLDEVSE